MPNFIHELLLLVEARPLTSVGVAIGAVLYMRLMLSGPRSY
ncbi:hypothetical protein [Phenylobacterium sp.]|nr:hypothetical protein [Phenylobacterium sp.]